MSVSGLFSHRFAAFPQEDATGTARRRPWKADGLHTAGAHRLPPLRHLLVIGALSILLWATLIGAAEALF
jgi:hypothetical protein